DGKPVHAPIQDIVLGSYALSFTNKAAAARLAEQQALHDKDPEKNQAPHVYTSPKEVLYHFETPNAAHKIKLNDPVKVLIKRPVFRPDAEVDYRDPETGVEYKKVTKQNELGDDIEEFEALEQSFETKL